MEKDAYYFPHFSNARSDRKLKRVTKELGVEGYGIYFMVLEVLRDQTGFKYPVEDIDLLADEFNTSEQKVRTVIANYKLFEIDADDMFFSARFNEFMQPYLTMKEQRRQAGIASGEARRIKAETKKLTNDRSTGVQRVLNENEQKKVKEKKEDTFQLDSIEYKASKYLFDKIIERNPNNQVPNLNTWAKHIDYMIRIDKRTPKQIADMIEWSQQDSFWQTNILSTKKLRDKYDTMFLTMNKTKKQKPEKEVYYGD